MNKEPVAPRPSPALADLFIPERGEEIAFWTKLASGYGRVVVNWHCGTGELAVGLAKNKLRVVGVDPDREALDIAHAREMELARNVASADEIMLTWLCHEPRLTSLPGPADFALISGDIFGSYYDNEQCLRLLNNIFQFIRPGGALGLLVPMAPASGKVMTTAISGPLRRLPKGFFARRVSTLRYEAPLLTVQHDMLIRLPDGEQRYQDTVTRRLFKPAEVFSLLHQAGFIAVGMWGGWDERPLRQATQSFIVRAERPMVRQVGKKEEPD